MASTIIGSALFNSRGLALTRQDAQEQINGLVTVQVEYVGPATKIDAISRQFYTDSAPPIWPSVVSSSDLLTRRLYMESRSISRANGLVTVQAKYVGALTRYGFRGYYVREAKESGKVADAYSYVNTDTLYGVSYPRPDFLGGATSASAISGTTSFSYTSGISVSARQVYTPTGALQRASLPTRFVFDEKVKFVEFVRIGGLSSVQLPVFKRGDCASIVRQSFGTALGQTLSSEATQSDLWVIPGSEDLLSSGLLSFEKNTPLQPTESSEFVTPSVEIVTYEYRLSR